MTASTTHETSPPPDFAKANGMADLYWLYFQVPGLAEADMERDTRETFLRLMYSVSGDAARRGESWNLRVDPEIGLIASLIRPDRLPPWLTEADLDRYAGTYARTGFTTSLNWYRCMTRTWQLGAAWADLKVTVPAFFIGGKDDPTLSQFGRGIEAMKEIVPDLRGAVMVDAGHWVQQEAPDAVSEGLIGFLKSLGILYFANPVLGLLAPFIDKPAIFRFKFFCPLARRRLHTGPKIHRTGRAWFI